MPARLFPELENDPIQKWRRVPVAVYLPTATTTQPSYSFSYNPYSELAEVTLPTGGKIQYDHDAGVDCDSHDGCYASGQILEKGDDIT